MVMPVSERVRKAGLAAGEAWKRKYPLWQVGCGPWLVLPDCPAVRHNSAKAARRADPRVRCICPQGQALRRAEQDRRAQNQRDYRLRKIAAIRAAGTEQVQQRAVRTALYLANVLTDNTPDLRGAVCAGELGRSIGNKMYGKERGGSNGVWEMKRLCSVCPVVKKCGDWALSGERMPGDWGGVYGGMSAADRVKEKQRRADAALKARRR